MKDKEYLPFSQRLANALIGGAVALGIWIVVLIILTAISPYR